MSHINRKFLAFSIALFILLTACGGREKGPDQNSNSQDLGQGSESGTYIERTIQDPDKMPITNGEFVETPSGSRLYKGQGTFFDAFDTVISVTYYCEDQESFEKLFKLTHDEFLRLHKLYDNYNTYEGLVNVMTLNEAAGKEGIRVDEDLFQLIQMAKDLYDKGLGKVNIAMGSVLSLWHEAREFAEKNPTEAKLPDPQALKEASRHMDINKLVLDEKNRTVKLEDPAMSLDLGAVAKGYATDKIAQTVKKSGLKSGLISAGGNVKLIGENPMGREWRVGIEDPSESRGDPKVVVDLKADMSLVTSGDYQRYFIVDGKRYHHIIDPVSLEPGGRSPSLTIETQDSGLADFLSTALFLADESEEKKILDNFKQAGQAVEDIRIEKDGSYRASDGIKGDIE